MTALHWIAAGVLTYSPVLYYLWFVPWQLNPPKWVYAGISLCTVGSAVLLGAGLWRLA